MHPRGLRIAVLFVLLGSAALSPAAGNSQAQSSQLKPATQVELDVIKVLLKQEAAWNRGDIDSFAEGYKDSPDTLFINNQVQRGYAGMVDAYHRNYPNRDAMGTLTFSELEVHPLDDKIAVCIGKYHLDRSKSPAETRRACFRSSSRKRTRAGRSSWTTRPDRL